MSSEGAWSSSVFFHVASLGERKKAEDMYEANLSARFPSRPVIIVPADTCPDQQSIAPRAPAPHHGCAQKAEQVFLKLETIHQRASRLQLPPPQIGWAPSRHFAHIYLLYQLCPQTRGADTRKKLTIAGKKRKISEARWWFWKGEVKRVFK